MSGTQIPPQTSRFPFLRSPFLRVCLSPSSLASLGGILLENSPRPERGIQLLSLLFCRKALPLGCILSPSLTLLSSPQSQASTVCRKPISRQTVQHSFLSLFRGPEKAQPGKGWFTQATHPSSGPGVLICPSRGKLVPPPSTSHQSTFV